MTMLYVVLLFIAMASFAAVLIAGLMSGGASGREMKDLARLQGRGIAGLIASAVAFAIVAACGAPITQMAPTIIKGTLGGLYGACQTVDSDDATWRRICSGVEQAMPALNQLGAGPAELPPDVAAREVVITIGGEP